MAKTNRHPIQRSRRLLFARIGWMRFYNGSVPGDERPVGGGKYNKSAIGHEVYNFKQTNSRLYGYFQPTMSSHSVALERIDPAASDANELENVLVVFVARRPEGGQVIVGWYRDAKVLRSQAAQSPGKPKGYGHFCSASRHNCVLLPTEKRSHEIPGGRGGFGQANVCYPLDRQGEAKKARWIQDALAFIDDYTADDILANPTADAEQDSAIAAEKALARSKGQGFPRTSSERRALEDRAMALAKRHFRKQGFRVEDVSARRPYDLLCKRGAEELHVEVKGTMTDGKAVVLTNNEVKHACNSGNSCALFVLHSMRLNGKKASGGKKRVLLPWRIEQAHLTPVSYTYRLLQ
jgi:hypothetical protein